MSITPRSPDPTAREKVRTWVTSQRKLGSSRVSSQQKSTGEQLRLTALVFLAGIAWYMGQVLRGLIEDGRIEAAELNHTAFALSGRGAGLFKKMHGTQNAEANSIVTRVLRVFGKAAGLDDVAPPQLFTSPEGKLEVVRGMIDDGSSIDAYLKGSAGASTARPAGLQLGFKGRGPIAATETFLFEALTDRVSTVELDGIDALLAELRARSGITINLFASRGQGAAQHIAGSVRSGLDQAVAKKLERVDPPFILAIKALVAELAAPVTGWRDRISAGFGK